MKRRLLTAAALLTLIPLPLLANDPGSCLDLGAKERTSYVITTRDGHTMCGDVGDVVYADESRPKGEAVVWFRIDDGTWVIRDPAVNAEARRLFTQVNEIGRKQGEIGAKQGVLGAEQGRLGAEQAKIGTKQAVAALRDEPAEDYSARMRELGDRMAVLGREQGKYGEQMAALGEAMQRELAVAQRGLSQLLDRAMKDGTAVRVRRL
jgi:bla regulator protein BlaR1